MAVLTSLILRVLLGMFNTLWNTAFSTFIFWFSFAIYNCHLVSVAGSQLGDNAPDASALTLVSIPQDNNYVTWKCLEKFLQGEWTNWVSSLDCHKNMELCLSIQGEKFSSLFVPAQQSRGIRMCAQGFMNVKNWIIQSLCMYQMLSISSIYYYCKNPKKQTLGILVTEENTEIQRVTWLAPNLTTT